MSSAVSIRRLAPPLLMLLGALGLVAGAGAIGRIVLVLIRPLEGQGEFTALAILSSLGAVLLSCGVFFWSRGFDPGPRGLSLQKLLLPLAGLPVALAAYGAVRLSLGFWIGFKELASSDVMPAIEDVEAGARIATATLRLHFALVVAGTVPLGVAAALGAAEAAPPPRRRRVPLFTGLSGIGAGLFLALANVLLLVASFQPPELPPARVFPWLARCLLSLALGGILLGGTGVLMALGPFLTHRAPGDHSDRER